MLSFSDFLKHTAVQRILLCQKLGFLSQYHFSMYCKGIIITVLYSVWKWSLLVLAELAGCSAGRSARDGPFWNDVIEKSAERRARAGPGATC